jgi:hypothetical protein
MMLQNLSEFALPRKTKNKKAVPIAQRRLNYYCLTVPCDGTQYLNTLQSVRHV